MARGNAPGVTLPERNLVSQQDRSMIQRPDIPRSKFTGSWTRKMSFDQGVIYPFMIEEVLPGDHLRYDVTCYVRMATLLFPLMDNLRVDTHFFFVPNRIVWSNWVRMMGEQDSPSDTIAYTIPAVAPPNSGFVVAQLADYMGLPTTVQNNGAEAIFVNALPFRAYNLIWNQWFRDENLDTAAFQYTGDATQAIANYVLRPRAKSHDYFTSALPWPQKFTAPSIPLGSQAPVRGIGSKTGVGGQGWPGYAATAYDDVNFGTPRVAATAYGTAAGEMIFDTNTGVYADLSAASGVAINTLRQAFLVQQLLERDARGGTRYTELVRSHFGVTSPDARLQRPEYLGGGQTPIAVTPIAQTATGGGGLGALAGAGTGVGSHRASYAATEHGHILGLVSIKSELSYMQGIRKMWSRSTRYDFYWPALAGLGEQAVLRKELYWINEAATDNLVFGYQERWHEYRTRVSEVAGLFRGGKNASGALAPWILSQRFVSAPVLGSSFIADTAPMATVLAAGGAAINQQFLGDFLIRREAVRPIPMFGTPVLLGRF